MKKITVLLSLVMLFPSVTFAGEIYGSIKMGGTYIRQGTKVEIISASNTSYSKETDKYGSYSIHLKEEGKCRLIVHYQKQSPEIMVSSYKTSVRYNLVLEQKDEKYFLRRK